MKITPRSIAKKILQAVGLHAPLMAFLTRRKFWKLQKAREDSIMGFKRRFKYDTFIETGTYHGDMVEAMKTRFKRIYSIELGDDLYTKACERFRGDKHIHLLHGDSAAVLPQVLRDLHEPAIFWLDAHDSGGDTARGSVITPIESELEALLQHSIKNHVILIDDARDFTGRGGYPTVAAIEKLACRYGYLFEMKNDNLRIYPRTPIYP